MLTIGKLALGSAVTSDTIRYYEKEGLLAPAAKTGAGYRPVPHLELFRLLPVHDSLPQSYKLGLSLPACTLPLIIITGILSALTRQSAIAALAGLVFALMFTLPTLWESTQKFSAAQRNFLGHAARISPYVTTLLLRSGALFIFKTGI